MNIFKTKAGWVKRLPEGNIGPFATKAEAEASYGPAKKVEEKFSYSKKSKKDSVENAFKTEA